MGGSAVQYLVVMHIQSHPVASINADKSEGYVSETEFKFHSEKEILIKSISYRNFVAVASGQVGLAILSTINLIGYCQSGLRQSAELENQMTSVERIIEYGEIPAEPPLESDKKNAPPIAWPHAGNIEFKSLSLRYTEHSNQVLRNLSFNILPKV